MGQKDYKEILKQKRDKLKKPDNAIICNRCHQLKNQGELIELDPLDESLEEPLEGEVRVGKPTNLSALVASFDRKAIVNELFK